jgi:hypothetical protein
MIDMNKKLISGLIVLIIAILAVAAFSMGDNSTSDKSNATEIQWQLMKNLKQVLIR